MFFENLCFGANIHIVFEIARWKRIFCTKILIQRPEREVALRATGFLVIKTIQPHIRLLDFLRAVVKRIEGVHFCRDGYFHFGRENRVVAALDALRGYFKYSGHNEEVLVVQQ